MPRIDLASQWKSRSRALRTVLLLSGGLAFGLILGGLFAGDGGGTATGPTPPAPAARAQMYTCSMHPQIRLPDPNARCPICGMELIPVADDSGDAGASGAVLTMSPAARALAEVETAPVERRFVVKEVRLVGKVGYDETRLRSITAWVPGRLDRLYVDYTGVAVRQGAPLVYMYSPELLVAQEGLLKADHALEEMQQGEAAESAVAMQKATVDALVQRLKLWGLSPEQIADIRKSGTASDHMTILSPTSGIVIHKLAVQGDYVGVGTKIYEIADLSRVWVYLDAYESDMEWVRYAQEVEFEAEAYPGDVFRGHVAFIDPFLDERTRTVKLRVTVENPDGRLKPGMFVHARIHARLAEGGNIVEPYLQGKWISPVHPEIVMSKPGVCPLCGTPLVAAEALGYAGADATPPLVVPATAPLRTGARAVVYVEVPGADRPTYEGREIELGPRAGDFYLVKAGLREGERVVVKGNFKIDSALQIRARPSMMSADDRNGAADSGFDVPESFLVSLDPLYRGFLVAQVALAEDDAETAHQALDAALGSLDEIDASPLTGREREFWTEKRRDFATDLHRASEVRDLPGLRAVFEDLSNRVLELAGSFGQATGGPLFEQFCPMAFENRGASWLAGSERIQNPYFGSKMPDCGEVRRTFPSSAARTGVSPRFRTELGPVYDALLELQRSLAADDLAAAREKFLATTRALEGVAVTPASPSAADSWSELEGRALLAADQGASAVDLAIARGAFERLSGVGLALVRRFGHSGPVPLVEAFCPMAFAGKGAAWLQAGDEIVNPYMGQEMLRCGEIRDRFPPASKAGVTPAFREGMSACVGHYLDAVAALSRDDLEPARSAAGQLEEALAAVPASALDGESLDFWKAGAASMRDAAETMKKATDLQGARRAFALVSDSLARLLSRFGHAGPDDLVGMHCPMAFDNRGADWIQRGKTVSNPYFGAAMPECGEATKPYPAEVED